MLPGSAIRQRLPRLPIRLCMTLLLWTLVLGAPLGWAATNASTNLIFILDASGSMGSKVQGKMKMDIAKDVLAHLITDLPAGAKVGLVAYGHREKRDCNDVETLAPLAPVDKQALVETIKALDHQGMTPITESVRRVAEGLRELEGETTIVLVSDGEETCEGDPCGLVKELKASGIQFVMQVIGFAVTDKEKVQLACMADAGGGAYFTAKNAQELAAAAKRVIAKTEASSGGLRVQALRNGKPVGARYEVFSAGAVRGEGQEPLATNPIGMDGETIKLAPGVYDLRIRNIEDAGNPVIDFSGIEVEAGQSVEKVADFSGGTLEIRALRNGAPAGAWFSVFKSGDTEANGGAAVASNPVGELGEAVKLTPGVYDLTLRDQGIVGSPVVSVMGIDIQAGKTVAQVAAFSAGTLAIKATKRGQPVVAWYAIRQSGTGEAAGSEPIAANPVGQEGETVDLPPGVYTLEIRYTGESAETVAEFQGVAIQAGQVVERVGAF